MSTIGVPEFLSRAQHHRAFLVAERREAIKLNEQAGRYAQSVEQGLEAARLEAAAAFLPGFDPVSLATAERLLHLPAGWAHDRVRLVEVEDGKLAKRCDEIEADDRYQFRGSYLGENGEWTGERATADKAFHTAHQHALRYEHQPRFLELMRSGYGTEAYRPGCMGFFDRNPKAAAAAVEALGKSSWNECRSDYQIAVDTHHAKKKTLDEVKARIASLEALLTERDAAIARRADLKGTGPLLDTRAAIADHLKRADRRLLATTAKASGRQECLAAVAKLDGLDSQASYLLSMNRDESEVKAIEQELQGLDRDIAESSRPKKAYEQIPVAKVYKRFHDRPARLRKRLERRRKFLERVYAYDDWDPYYDFDDDVPWFFYMVGRSDPGYGFSDTTSFLRHHPHYVFARPERIVPPDDDDDDDGSSGADDDDDRTSRKLDYDAAAAASALSQGSDAGGDAS